MSILTVFFKQNKCLIGEKGLFSPQFLHNVRWIYAEICIVLSFLPSFCLILQLTSQNITKKSRNDRKNGPKWAKKASKRGQNDPKTTPKWCKTIWKKRHRNLEWKKLREFSVIFAVSARMHGLGPPQWRPMQTLLQTAWERKRAQTTGGALVGAGNTHTPSKTQAHKQNVLLEGLWINPKCSRTQQRSQVPPAYTQKPPEVTLTEKARMSSKRHQNDPKTMPKRCQNHP